MLTNFDLFATCLALAGVEPPQDGVIDGRDIMPLLVDGALSPHETLLFYDTRKLVALRHGKLKYYRRNTTDNAGYWPLKHGPFLFDISRDPNESYSLIESEPAIAAEMEEMLQDRETEMQGNLRGWLE